MLLNRDIERLDAVFDDFIQATGVYISLLNEDLTYHYAKLNPYNQFCKSIDSCPEGFRACRRCSTASSKNSHRSRSAPQPIIERITIFSKKQPLHTGTAVFSVTVHCAFCGPMDRTTPPAGWSTEWQRGYQSCRPAPAPPPPRSSLY